MGNGDHNAGGKPCDGLASHPGGSSNIPSRFMLQKPELSAGLIGLLARMQTLPTYLDAAENSQCKKAWQSLALRYMLCHFHCLYSY